MIFVKYLMAVLLLLALAMLITRFFHTDVELLVLIGAGAAFWLFGAGWLIGLAIERDSPLPPVPDRLPENFK